MRNKVSYLIFAISLLAGLAGTIMPAVGTGAAPSPIPAITSDISGIRPDSPGLQDMFTWVDLGMPNTASFDLKVYPSDIPLKAAEDEWIVRRNEAQFLWSLRP